jgi:hypothetical protein
MTAGTIPETDGTNLRDALREAMSSALDDETMTKALKRTKELVDELEDSLNYNVRENLASNLSYFVEEMAKRAVGALLDGNEGAMRSYLQCDPSGWNGRSGDHNWGSRRIEDWHSVIHGKLFETGCIAVRKAICEAHADLLKNERVLDLEDQVKSLVAQVNKKQAEIDRLCDERRNNWHSAA